MPTWLHGTLYVAVMEGRNLPKHKNLSVRYAVPTSIDGCLGGLERLACASRPSQAYCTVNVGPSRRFAPLPLQAVSSRKPVADSPFHCVHRARTNVLGRTSNPDWHEKFEILVADEVDDLSFTVKDDNWIGVSYDRHNGHILPSLEQYEQLVSVA